MPPLRFPLRLLEMPETAREEILAERSEKKQRLNEQQKLADLLNQRSAIGTDSVAKAAKRLWTPLVIPYLLLTIVPPGQHTVRGATKEKTRKLDELKARRKAKDEKKRVGASFNDPWPKLTRDGRRIHPQSGIALHLPWIWRSQTRSLKMARSQSKIKKRKKNEGYSARLLSLTTRHRHCNILRVVDCQEIYWQSTVWRHGSRITSVVRNITIYGLQ